LTHFHLTNRIWHQFRQNWVPYSLLIFGTNFVISLIVIPLLNWLVEAALKLGHIDYVSYNNLNVLVQHPIVSLLLFVLLVIALLLVYWQFSFIMRGIYQINVQGHLRPGVVFLQTIHQRLELSITSFFFFLGYFVLVLPFAGIGFHTALLAKVKIPAFVLSDLITKPWAAVTIAITYIIVLYLGLRLLFVLPKLVIKKFPVKQAIRDTWHQTKGHIISLFLDILVLSLCIALITVISYVLIIAGQTLFDHYLIKASFLLAVINLALIQFVTQMMVIFSTFGIMSILLTEVKVTPAEPQLLHHRRFSRTFTVIALGAVAIGFATFNAIYLKGMLVTRPLEISHRGVDNGNGVQNTLQSLRKTSSEHPDLIEMDLHETKDHQFVVMHDENLKKLTGVNKAPYQLTLAQLKRLTAHENGYHAKVTSFDDYLHTAIKLHQRLLIEIKTTPHDSSNMLQLFVNRYGTTLLTHHEQVHSLDYHVITGLKRTDPKQFVSFILPYNLAFPHTKANAYTMEATTLNDSFVDQAQNRQQKVYAWTVNDDQEMQSMLFNNVNGIITDQLSELQQTVSDNINHPSYATRLVDYVIDLPTTNMPLN
jgi:glycerophosphoryl diester phosphodiesterase